MKSSRSNCLHSKSVSPFCPNPATKLPEYPNPVAGAPGTTFSGTFTLPSGTTTLLTSSTSTEVDAITGVISGSGAVLTISDAGTMDLFGVNTYTGGTILQNNIVTINNNSSFGTGAITPAQNVGSPGYVGILTSGSTAITLGNAWTINTASAGVNFAGSVPITCTGNWTLTQQLYLRNNGSGANTLTLSGIIGGAQPVLISANNSGTIILSGVNTYSGATTLGGGSSAQTVTISGSGSLGSGNYAGNISNSGTLNYSSSAAQILSGAFSSSSGTFNVNGPGTVTLSGTADNNSLGANVNNGGKLVLAKTSTSGVHALGAAITVNSGGTLQLGGSGGDQIYDGVTITVASGGVFDFNSKSETMTGLNLSGTGISSGGALINSTTTASSTLTCSSGINLAANSSIGGSGNITLASAIGGSGKSLTKVGTGTLTVNAANSYSGATTISAGTVALGANGVLPSATTVNLNGGTLNMSTFNNTVTALQFGGVGKAQGTWGVGTL